MFDRHVHNVRQPSFWEDWRKNVILAFILAVIAPALFGVAAAAADGNKEKMVQELQEGKKRSFTFAHFLMILIGMAFLSFVLALLLRMGLLVWVISVLSSAHNS